MSKKELKSTILAALEGNVNTKEYPWELATVIARWESLSCPGGHLHQPKDVEGLSSTERVWLSEAAKTKT
jgi:hypothetical protein